jgi:hypothetical protein
VKREAALANQVFAAFPQKVLRKDLFVGNKQVKAFLCGLLGHFATRQHGGVCEQLYQKLVIAVLPFS